MKPVEAEAHALRVLAWLAGTPDLAQRFLAETGIAPAELPRRAGEPELLAALLDFVLQEDGRVAEAAAALDMDPAVFAAIRAALPGGTDPHWT